MNWGKQTSRNVLVIGVRVTFDVHGVLKKNDPA